jgi:hypothetical protein
MASRRASVISSTSLRERKHSTRHDQRQAERSLLIEQGLNLRSQEIREEEVPRELLQNYFKKPRFDEPRSLTRADTALSPLELTEHHPGDKLFTPRGTLHDVLGAYQKPFEEPDSAQQENIEKTWSASRRALTRESDIEASSARVAHSRGHSSAQKSLFRRFLRPVTAHSQISPRGTAEVDAASLISVETGPRKGAFDPQRVIYVLEYSNNNDVLSSSPPHQFTNIKSLQEHLEKTSSTSVALRMIYSCNDEEAMRFLSSNFGISGSSADGDEKNFSDWMLDRRTSKVSANKARKWRPAYDRARNLVCSAFAVDFGRVLVSESSSQFAQTRRQKRGQQRRLHESDQRQRIAVYMQRTVSSQVPGAQMTSFNTGLNALPEYAKIPTIIISELSATGAGEIINAGPLLGLDVAQKGSDTSHAVVQAIEYILEHVVSGILQLWETQIDLLHESHTELEDYIWAQPADSSRAREVWGLSRRLHSMQKLINRHAKLIQFAQEDFRIFAERSIEQNWLDDMLVHFEQLSENISLDYVEPLAHLIDLVSGLPRA